MALLAPQWQPQVPLQSWQFSWSRTAEVELAVLRLDLIDPLISGNKWFKLAPYLQAAAHAGHTGLISLGGPHSNHLHALAAAGQRFAFPVVGLLRGAPQDTPTIRDLHAMGMQLHWLGYGGYRARHQADFWSAWQQRYPHLLPVDEGGLGLPAARSCATLRMHVHSQLAALGWQDYDGWWLAAGTGTTMAGLVMAEAGERPVYGALAVPSGHGVEVNVAALLTEAGMANQGYHLFDACRGGFARLDPQLLAFMLEAEQSSGVPLEPLYTAKALLALRQQVEAGYFARGTRLLFVHTGGLQGRRALLTDTVSQCHNTINVS